jgi:hypothetical protein
MRRFSLTALFGAVLTLAAINAQAATFVAASSSTPTAVATLIAGQTYDITASGIANLYVGFNGGLGLTFTANGIPTYTFPSPYTGFNPSGLNCDPSTSCLSGYGPGGATALLGELIGTFSATPCGPSCFFNIGLGTTFTAASNETLYAEVNDTYYPDNGGGYTVAVSAVPFPATAWLMLSGLVGVGAMVRKRRAA